MATSNENSHNRRGEHIRCMWLDGFVFDTDDNKELQKRLCEVFGRCKFVDNVKESRTTIVQSSPGTKFVLIVSGQLGSELVKLIHEDTRVCAIYVYCGDTNRHRIWADTFSKVRFFIISYLFIIILFI